MFVSDKELIRYNNEENIEYKHFVLFLLTLSNIILFGYDFLKKRKMKMKLKY